jgi:hypothetical protein
VVANNTAPNTGPSASTPVGFGTLTTSLSTAPGLNITATAETTATATTAAGTHRHRGECTRPVGKSNRINGIGMNTTKKTQLLSHTARSRKGTDADGSVT